MTNHSMTNHSILMRWSGLAAMLGGLLFAIAIPLHPLRHGEAVHESAYSAIHVLIAFSLFLVLLGLLGLYARQSEQSGRLGLSGFVLALVGTIWTYGLLITEGFLWPAVAMYDPSAVHNFGPDAVAARGSSLLMVFFLGLALFAIGYALFGVATMRTGQLPRSGGLLIAFGAVIYVVGAFSLPVLGPESLVVTIIETAGAIPFGAGFVRLGYALWSDDDAAERLVTAPAR